MSDLNITTEDKEINAVDTLPIGPEPLNQPTKDQRPKRDQKKIMIAFSIAIIFIYAGFIHPSLFPENPQKEIEDDRELVNVTDFNQYGFNLSYDDIDDKETISSATTTPEPLPVIPTLESYTYTAPRYLPTATPIPRYVPDRNALIEKMILEEEKARTSGMSIPVNPRSSMDSNNLTTGYNTTHTQQYANNYNTSSSQTAESTPEKSSYETSNMQDQKKNFYEQGRQNGDIYGSKPDLIPFTVYQNSIISAVLITDINSDLPGPISARVTRNVYDTVTGKNIIIPQGSTLLAQYNSSVSWGQSRVQISWSTLIRPDGLRVVLGNQPAIDASGASGLSGFVDNHFLSMLQGLLLTTSFKLLDAELNFHANNFNSEGLKVIAEANREELSAIGAKYVDNALSQQPTITVKKGTEIKVLTVNNIVLPPYIY